MYDLLALLTARAGGRSNVNDFILAAEACLPIISSIMVEIKKKTYPQNCFLNIDVPTDVRNHKVICWFVLAALFLSTQTIKIRSCNVSAFWWCNWNRKNLHFSCPLACSACLLNLWIFHYHENLCFSDSLTQLFSLQQDHSFPISSHFFVNIKFFM